MVIRKHTKVLIIRCKTCLSWNTTYFENLWHCVFCGVSEIKLVTLNSSLSYRSLTLAEQDMVKKLPCVIV